ncbi:Formylglycine-generating enzyme, required for sulfatase activity, contains SUMF1/FGE domain [Polaribacter sp. KT25b]|uniref:formylglycine-generating enzyme family protein n=1 Tax=Polaribacter sp. KT25b TaxID=1855336 RepID=UPI00087DCE8F|nr:formylglycine-generating enzyme family protein [Polaribacter sp. KT25b]SDR68539.1 Formylglycine-generating enzyme, required for sulfatase activity, contains SUMF1/FGE domain [Polaribacter sp. KT25b]
MYHQNKSKLFNYFSLIFLAFLSLSSCKNSKTEETKTINKSEIKTPEGMVWVESKTFLQGAKETDKFAMPREKPAHLVTVDGFYIDVTEVTNKQFAAFVDATKYVTIAERKIDWEEMKKMLPADTQKPHDSILQPGSLIFNKSVNAIADMNNYGQWWTWKIGANWKHPEGPNSTIEGKENNPVVHIALEDALAYCKWANRRLPTESEWESAAQGKNLNTIFTWGNDATILDNNANTWQGVFPTKNESKDGFEFISPVKSYPPNSIGLYDMAGNVWEITADLFNVNYYKDIDISQPLLNPKGANKSYSPSNPYQVEHVMKGGSFLCHESYCASFRISAKMGVATDSGSDHMGFRTVATNKMLASK